MTGASGGLGEAIARACASRGAQLIVTGRRQDVVRTLASAIGAESVCADLTDRADVVKLVESLGAIDVLVSNAALPAGGRLETFSIEEIDRALDVNLRAPMVLSRLLSEGMIARGRGHIVFVSSLAAAFPTPGLSIYNATKAALASYALSLRAELADQGVGVSVIYPGPIRDAGMWAETGLPAPLGLPTRSPQDVGLAVVDAIECNRADVAVAPLALRVGAFFGRAAPATLSRLIPRLGARDITAAMAESLRHKR